MASGYDVTKKLHQHNVLERDTRAVDDANTVLNVFCSCYTVISDVSNT